MNLAAAKEYLASITPTEEEVQKIIDQLPAFERRELAVEGLEHVLTETMEGMLKQLISVDVSLYSKEGRSQHYRDIANLAGSLAKV
jgi:hypothetical protein